MKKKWLILPVMLLAVAGLLMLGCPTGGGGGGGGGEGWTNVLDGVTVTLIKNTYATTAADEIGLQGKITSNDLFAGKQVVAGDKYKLEVTFTVDKAVTADLQFGLVDTTAAASYWKPLTWIDGNDMPTFAEAAALGTADTAITKTFELIALRTATGMEAAANAMVFECEDSWDLDPLTITFSKFSLTKLTDTVEVECDCEGDATACECGDDCDCEECEEPAAAEDPDFALGTGTKLIITAVMMGEEGEESVDFEVGQVTTINGKNADGSDRVPIETKYFDNNRGYTTGSRSFGNGYTYFKMDLEGGSLSDIASIKATYQGISGDIGWKGFALAVYDEEPVANYVNFENNNLAFVQTGYDGKTPKEFTFNLLTASVAAKVEELEGDELYFVFQIHGNDAAFKVSNITFVLKDGEEEIEEDPVVYSLDNFDPDFDFSTVIDGTVISLGFPQIVNPKPRWEITEDTEVAYEAFEGVEEGASIVIVLGDISESKVNFLQIAMQYWDGSGGAGWKQINVLAGGSPFPEVTGDAEWDADNNVITVPIPDDAIPYVNGTESGSSGLVLYFNAGGEENIDLIAVGILLAE
jgi:hypothetical protein